MSSAEAENGWWLAAGRGAVRPRVPTRRGLLGPAADIAAERRKTPFLQLSSLRHGSGRTHTLRLLAGAPRGEMTGSTVIAPDLRWALQEEHRNRRGREGLARAAASELCASTNFLGNDRPSVTVRPTLRRVLPC